MFRNKSKQNVQGANVKKSKSFKRIRGMLNGESRKERKARKAAERAARGIVDAGNDENSTVYGVDVDDRSVLTGPQANSFLNEANALDKPSNEKKAYILKVVLLLMDPETRRFELLQLEFDSLKALVSDVLAQIPISVTEEALRLQTYTGISGKDGVEMPPSKLLSSFCKGNEVLVAVPDGVAPKECARLARPILSDDKVVTMLASSGIDASGWKEKIRKVKPAVKPRAASMDTPHNVDASNKSSGSGKTMTVALVVLVALILQVLHIYVTAPIKLEDTLSPGIWLSKCGLMTILPSCEDSYMHIGRDGVVTHYGPSKEITWQMEGSVCDKEDENCTPGMVVQEDGKIVIGGKPIKYLTAYVKQVELSPWPFVDPPKLKIWKK